MVLFMTAARAFFGAGSFFACCARGLGSRGARKRKAFLFAVGSEVGAGLVEGILGGKCRIYCLADLGDAFALFFELEGHEGFFDADVAVDPMV